MYCNTEGRKEFRGQRKQLQRKRFQIPDSLGSSQPPCFFSTFASCLPSRVPPAAVAAIRLDTNSNRTFMRIIVRSSLPSSVCRMNKFDSHCKTSWWWGIQLGRRPCAKLAVVRFVVDVLDKLLCGCSEDLHVSDFRVEGSGERKTDAADARLPGWPRRSGRNQRSSSTLGRMANHRKCCCSIGDRNLSGLGWITGSTSSAREVEEVEEDIFIFQCTIQPAALSCQWVERKFAFFRCCWRTNMLCRDGVWWDAVILLLATDSVGESKIQLPQPEIQGLREFAILQVWQLSGRRSWLRLEQESKTEGRVAAQTSWEYWELQPEERSRTCCLVLLHHHQSCSAVRYRYAFAFSCSPYSWYLLQLCQSYGRSCW